MLILCSVLFPIIAGVIASNVKTNTRARHIAYSLICAITDVLVILALSSKGSVTVVKFFENVSFSFAVDDLGVFFLIAVMLLFTAVLFYSFEYMKMEKNEERFFGFYFVTFGAMIAMCMAENPVTMYLCFELLTLLSVPLVLHDETKEAVTAGLKYLFYSIAGALMGLPAVYLVYRFAGAAADFTYGGFIDPSKLAGHEGVFLAFIFIGILGFGTKAGLYPMHGWLPTAHPAAPAPASALLSGIIAKAGVFAVIRLLFYSVGTEILRGTWVQNAFIILAMITIFMGSMTAFLEKNLKRRLAYSTISQISYILLGIAFLSDEGLEGGLIHVLSHASSKACLFLCAGVFIYKLGIRNVEDLRGIGKRMPVTLWCFTIASLSLIGIPPMGGFISKWVIGSAALDSGMGALSILAPVVLIVSAFITAGYLLPIVIDGFFPGKDYKAHAISEEPSKLMTIPMIVLCAASVIMGIWGVNIVNAIMKF